MNDKICEIVTNKIITELEKGNIVWKKTWKNDPISHQTKKRYTGFNYWRLLIECMNNEYSTNLWLTYKQAKRLNGHVKKGEKGTSIIFYKMLQFDNENKKTGEKEIKTIPLLRYFNVWNIAQTEKIETPKWYKVNDNSQIKNADDIYKNMLNKPKIKHGGNKASYNPTTDIIQMPPLNTFETSQNYYCTQYHELTHSTGSEKRLKRLMNTDKQSGSYAKEELTAELGASILCHRTGINNEKLFKNNTAYIQNWLKALKNDKTLIIKASSQAEKATKYILNENQTQSKKEK